MTPRERQTPEGGPATADRLACTPPALATPESRPGSLWEELFHAANPAQQRQLLELAARQGVLYASQITPPPNGSLKPIQRPLLSSLLSGPVPRLETARLVPGEPLDSDLDPAQREAVDRALGTPDLCLIQGGPGTGKSRVIAEIVARTARRGERVLLLAPSPAALDRVLERLEAHEGLCPVRCLGPGEAPEGLAPCIRRLTYAERLRSFREQTLARAYQGASAARQAVQCLRADESFGPRLEELARCYEGYTRQSQTLSERRLAAAGEVDAVAAYLMTGSPADPGSSFQARLADCARAWEETRGGLDARLAAIRADADKARSELETLTKALERLRPLTEAKKAGRWWTGAWWRATFHAGEVAHFEDRIARHHELEAERDRLTSDAGELTRARTEAEARMVAERDRLVEAEKSRRRSDFDDQIAALEQERRLLRDKWQSLWQELGTGSCPPPSGDAVQSGLTARAAQLHKADQELAFAEDWVRCLEETLRATPGRLSVCFNVVAATTLALPLGEEILGNSRPAPFDLLVLDEAEQVTESEFLQAARGAGRWVLVGATASEEREPKNDERKAKPGAGRSAFLDPRSSMFQRVWQRLHPDLRSLPYRWSQKEGRLHCRLRTVPADLERWVESEPVLDRPEVELRIVAPPGKPSQLAEVIFPVGTTIDQAKPFVYRELDEPALQVRSPYFRWVEGPDGVELLLDPAPSESVALPLGPGVTERVAVAEARHALGTTTSLHFDRAAGWDRGKAEQWVEEHLQVRDPGRTALLAVPQRTRPALARVLADLLPAGHFPQAGRSDAEAGCSWGGSVFELVAVPPLADEPDALRRGESDAWRRKGGTATAAPRLRAGRGGAGLEVDLAGSRPLEQLPAELRAALPREGLVNYFEARAVVRYLEGLLTEPRFRAAAEEWRREAGCLGNPVGCDGIGSGAVPGCRPVHSPVVAVMTPYLAQAELIRLLAAQSHVLAAADFPIEIGLPADFRQRECLVGLLSLTRSHTHRAVTYGEGPEALALALTRAAGRLVVFADPGTLARRTVWQGAVDHLGEDAAASERELATRLLRFLSGPTCESGRA